MAILPGMVLLVGTGLTSQRKYINSLVCNSAISRTAAICLKQCKGVTGLYLISRCIRPIPRVDTRQLGLMPVIIEKAPT